MVNDDDPFILYGTRIINKYTCETLLDLPGATVEDYMVLLNQLHKEYESHLDELEKEIDHHKNTINSLRIGHEKLLEALREKHELITILCQKKNIPIEHINARCKIYEPTE